MFFLGSSTLPRAQTRATDTDTRTDKVTAATSSTSLYDNVGATTQTSQVQGINSYLIFLFIVIQKFTVLDSVTGTQKDGAQVKQTRDRGIQQQSQETSTMTTNTATGPKTVTASVGTQNNVNTRQLIYFFFLIKILEYNINSLIVIWF